MIHDTIAQLIAGLLRVLIVNILFGLTGYHALRAIAAFVVNDTTNAKQHAIVAAVFGVAAVANMQ
jgi:hypothetical protein